ncbi:MAG TPA: outer membrane protein transport protein [Burkholderiales bacterium]|nr:outer membrane protein transport protein [Burkholderiales bacterium]
MKPQQNRVIAWAVAVALAGGIGTADAGGFGIGTQSGSGTGNAFAGGAAAAEDASVAWYNPAAMTALEAPRQAAGALHVLKPSFKFSNTGSTGIFAAPGSGEGGDAGDWAVVPNAFFTTPLGGGWYAGLAVNVPFGLKTDYDPLWRGQLTALVSEIKSVNLNPSIAYKISDTLSIGVGVSAQYLEAKLSSFSGLAALGNATLKADDIGYGFNFGVLFQPMRGTHIGVSYRSSIKYDLEGTVRFSGPGAAGFNGDIRADLRVPESWSVSALHTMGKLELMADVTRTGWDRVQQLVVQRTTPVVGAPAGSTFSTLSFGWKDTWRYSIGANYRLNDALKLRFGVAYDETPTNDATRTPRLPDQDRRWVAAGVQYKATKAGTLEVGYAHEFMRDARVNVSVPPAPGSLIGQFDNKADIISVQYSHAF